MNTFLELVAKDICNKIGKDLSEVAVIFPNKRASLFFNEYLANQNSTPIWAPTYLSISEFFQQLSPLSLGDPIRLVCELHKVFCSVTKSEESLSDFYFWGELLISDFDDVDKNLVDAKQLFANLKDLKALMDDLDFLDEEQEKAIQQFFKTFSPDKQTELKKRFLSLWDCLSTIYHDFKKNINELGIAYEGMLYRAVLEQMEEANLPYKKFVFVGFNVLNEVEKKLFQHLKDKGRALFYWDYDVFYTDNPNLKYEAGEFILRNLKLFSNELGKEHFDKLNKPKHIHFIAASTENEQARYLPQWIENHLAENERENAVVLCNESLLLPALHSIPKQVNHLNVTMGFPLSQTPIHSFIMGIIELQTEGYNPKTGRYLFQKVLSVLNHPYTRKRSDFANQIIEELTSNNRFYPTPAELQKDDFLKALFTPTHTQKELCKQLTRLIKEVAIIYNEKEESSNAFTPLYKESLFKGYTLINRLYTLIESGELKVNMAIFIKLLERLLVSTQIPFHGEPAIGLQVMGVLETRNLDFKNIIMLSVNEGQLPKKGGETSFIPYNIRKAFGMTTLEHKNAVYAYYFYRLLQRAENITLVYNNTRSDQNEGEWSRFMLQLLIELPQPIKQYYLNSQQKPQITKPIVIDKTDETLEKLKELYDCSNKTYSFLSPSALNTYLDCRLKFYYRYIAKLTPPEEVSPEIDSSLFGSIFHRASELTYQYLSDRSPLITKEEINKLIKEPQKIRFFVDKAFRELLFHSDDKEKPEYNGTQLINSKVIQSYLTQLLKYDINHTPFELIATEKAIQDRIKVKTPHGEIKIKLGGYIDRVDRKDNVLRIIDYKTGSGSKLLKELDSLFDREAKNRPSHIFQTFLYASIMCRQKQEKIAPAILYLRETTRDDSPIIQMGHNKNSMVEITNFALLADQYNKRLQELLEELFDNHTAFNQTEFINRCSYCDYKQLCHRESGQ